MFVLIDEPFHVIRIWNLELKQKYQNVRGWEWGEPNIQLDWIWTIDYSKSYDFSFKTYRSFTGNSV